MKLLTHLRNGARILFIEHVIRPIVRYAVLNDYKYVKGYVCGSSTELQNMHVKAIAAGMGVSYLDVADAVDTLNTTRRNKNLSNAISTNITARDGLVIEPPKRRRRRTGAVPKPADWPAPPSSESGL